MRKAMNDNIILSPDPKDINGLAPVVYCVTTADKNGCIVNNYYTVNAGPTAIAVGIEAK